MSQAEPLELPAAGAFLQQGARATWIGHDASLVRLLKRVTPARGFVVLCRGDAGWRSWRLSETTMQGARRAACAVVRKSDTPVVLGAVTATTGGGQAFLVDAVARFEPVTEAALLRRGQAAADEALALLQKADDPDPFKTATFDAMVGELGDTLTDKSDDTIEAAVHKTVEKTNIDWAEATESDHKRFSVALAAALGVAAGVVWKQVRVPLIASAETMAVQSAAAFVANNDLGVGVSLALTDKAAVARAASANQFYIRDFYTGNVSPALSSKARQIASAGIAQGHGSEVIANELYDQLGNTAVGLNRQYMNVVASAVNGRARSYSSLAMMSRAGVRRYRIDSVLDDNTTDTCRWLDGKEFSVGQAMARHRAVDELADPMDIRHVLPWTREKKITSGQHKGKRGIFVPNADGGLDRVAVIEKSAFGSADKVGQYSTNLTDRQLASRGLGFPQYHAYCRTTVSAV